MTFPLKINKNNKMKKSNFNNPKIKNQRKDCKIISTSFLLLLESGQTIEILEYQKNPYIP